MRPSVFASKVTIPPTQSSAAPTRSLYVIRRGPLSPTAAQCNENLDAERLSQRVEGHFALLAAVEVLELRNALGEFVVADDQHGAGVELVGALHAPFHVAAVVLLHGDAQTAQGPGKAQRPG